MSFDVGAAFGEFWKVLGDEFKSVGAFLASLFSNIGAVQAQFDEIEAKCQSIESDLKSVLDQIKEFKFDPKFDSRVISVPLATVQIKQWIADVPSRIATHIAKLTNDLQADVAQAKADIQGAAALSGQPGAAGTTKLAAWTAAAGNAVADIKRFLDNFDDIVQALKDIVSELENLDALFLQQKNPRFLKDGLLLRRGKLHPS